MKSPSIMLRLHLLFILYSVSNIFSKLAASEVFLSVRFCINYFMAILFLGAYAIGWQQIIKRMPLTTAFANKAVTVIWGLIFGALWFQERVTVGKLLGASLVVCGVVLFAREDGKNGET